MTQASRDRVAGTPTVLLVGEPLAWAELEPTALAAVVHAAR